MGQNLKSCLQFYNRNKWIVIFLNLLDRNESSTIIWKTICADAKFECLVKNTSPVCKCLDALLRFCKIKFVLVSEHNWTRRHYSGSTTRHHKKSTNYDKYIQGAKQYQQIVLEKIRKNLMSSWLPFFRNWRGYWLLKYPNLQKFVNFKKKFICQFEVTKWLWTDNIN